MANLDFVWDEQKARSNQQKHGISFEEAQTTFYDVNARRTFDPEHSQHEDRFILLGMSSSLRVLVVCHVYIGDDERVRLISARKATKFEQKQYWSFIP